MSSPAALARDLRFALDPVLWAKERIGFIADPWQARVLRSTSKRLIINNSRQSGKSMTTAVLATHSAIFNPGSLILLFSKAQRRSGELFGKIAGIYKQISDGPRLDSDNLTSCRLSNGSRIVSLPGDGDSVRGFSAPSMCICDEAAYISDSLYSAIRPMLSVSNGRLILLSTPHGRRGAFYRAWTDPSEEWERIRVTADECPRISEAFLENERQTLGPQFFAQEFMAEFVENEMSVFSSDSIEAAIDPTLLPLDITLAFGVAERTFLR